VPAFHGNAGFNAHHAPFGAFFTFTCGHPGTRGGLAAQLGKPANQDLYIGVKEGGRYAASPLRCLPFYEGAEKDGAASFLVEQAPAAGTKGRVMAYGAQQVQREYGWGTDTWRTEDFKFVICTPFEAVPDPATAGAKEMRRALLPAVVAELRVDNTKGTGPKTGFFAIGFHEGGVRVLDEGLGGGRGGSARLGFGLRGQLGVAGELFDVTGGDYAAPADAPFAFMRWAPAEGMADRDNPVHLLGNCPGIGFEVPAGKCYALTLALGCYLDGVVTTRLEGRYLYTRYFAGLGDVLDDALNRGFELWKVARQRDAELLASGLNADQQFLVAHATRSYHGSTQLLEVGGRPYWVVNEGEYCMLNTLDLSVDQVFWELRWNPWVVRNLLDNFARFYAYHDEVKDPKTGELSPGGISFCHDQGVHNQFAPLGHSSYELTNLDGCFSHMTQEQLCNWVLIAACYVAKTGDVAWLRASKPTVDACLDSMLQRDNPDDTSRNGIMEFDSGRCGRGQEITTYDSLDASLGQARNNLYLAVKCWATYLGLGWMFARLGEEYPVCMQLARRAAKTIAAFAGDDGVLPAVMEPDNAGFASRILPAIEGLVYPMYWAGCAHFDIPEMHEDDRVREWISPAPGTRREFLDVLKRHTRTLLADAEGRNRFADGGVKLSSTSNNSWASKIAIFEHVARELFNLDERGGERAAGAGPAGWEGSDAAHRKWQTEGASAYWACSDQMVNGVAAGSKYYPRIVTTVLWMGDVVRPVRTDVTGIGS